MKKLYLLALLFLCFGMQSQAQTYCTPSYTGYGFQNQANTAIAFFTHIKNVSFGNLNRSTTPPLWYTQLGNYQDYTTDTAEVAKTGVYPLSVFLGNGANPQTMAVWIDWNQNAIFEASERIMAQFDPANQGTHIIKTNVTIPANAKTGVTRMRVGTRLSGSFNPPDPCKNNDVTTATSNWSQDFQDYSINVKPAATQVFVSATCFRNNFDEVTQGSADNLILGIEVNTNNDGVLSPLSTGDFNLSTLGTSNPADLFEARIYYTGLSPDFSTSNQIGNGYSNPAGSFSINAPQKLQPGKNYFWLVYDVNSPAIIGNDISARLLSLQVSGINRNPVTSNPSGTRKIGYCVSKGTQMNFIGVWNVQMGSINNNTFYQQFSPYTYYSWLKDTIYRNTLDSIRIQIGNGVNSSKVRVWMDWNRDGDFFDQDELIFDTVNFIAQQTTAIYPFLRRGFVVPANATVGITRMRVSAQQRTIATLDPCTNPIDIGEVEDYNVLVADSGEPIAEFKYNTVCLGSATRFNDASYTFGNYNINSWVWDFGDPNATNDTSTAQNPTYTYTAPGVYNVSLTVNSSKPGQAQTITKAVTVEDPKADFSFTAPVYQTPVTFNDLTTGGNVFFWRWYFGDPQSGKNDSAFGSSPVHVFDTAGYYDVTLIVMTSGGCMDTIVKKLHILQQQVPVADFTASSFNPYVGQKVNLLDQSVYKPTKWKWTITPSKYTFYNNTNDSSQNPVVSFDSLTTYTVFLEATNAAGSTTTSKQITTKNYSKPTAIIGAQTTFVRVGEQVSFIDSSSNDPTSWNWEFGDTASGINNASNQQYPYHAYGKAGYYDVKLKVANPAGNDSTERKAYIQVSNGFNMCDNTATSSQVFQGFLYDSGGPNSNYNDGSDCEFLIEPPCAGKIFFSFSSFNVAAGDYIQVYDGRDSVNGVPLFTGRGFTGTNNPGTLVANSGAIYVRELSDATANASGFSASWSAAPNVKPRARIGNDSIAWVNSPINFRNTTTVGLQNKYYWDFDDDGKDDDSTYQPQYNYNSVGMRRVRLVAMNCAGTDTLYKYINIKVPIAAPVAGFISDDDTVAVADYVKFTDLSLNGPSSWFWEITPATGVVFVNGTTQTSQNPEVVFTMAGNYNVCLTATNAVGSSQKLCKSNYIIVKDRAAMCVGNSSSTVAAGYFYDSGDQASNYGDNENCSFLIQSCADNVVLTFSMFDVQSGDYLRVYDGIDNTGVPLFPGNGFSGNTNPGPLTGFSGSLYIEFQSDNSGTGAGWEAQWSSGAAAAPKASFMIPAKAYTNCVTWLRNSSTGNNIFSEWDFDNNGTVDSTNREGYTIYNTPGNKTALLSVSNCAGSDAYTASFNVQNPTVKPVAGFFANYTMGDLGSVIYLYDTSLNGTSSWTWSITPAAGWVIEEDLGYRLRVNFTDSGDYTICLTAGNAFGTDQACKNAYIKIRPYCKPSPSFFSGVGISRITLNNFAQNSPIDRLYSDYTGLGVVSKLERKAAYDLTLEKNVSGTAQNWKAWVDWDNSGTFDNNEVILTAGASGALTVTANFRVDRNALLGVHRMRVSASYNNNPNTPCNILFGEVQDYLIEVTNDITKPVITLIGSNPDSLEQGYTYNEKGATAFDLADGNISASIISNNNLNNMVVGSYQVTYDVKDSAGNKADQVVRTVMVTDDITPPALALNGSTVEKVLVKVPYVDKGYTSNDKVDGNITAGVLVTGVVNINKLGSYPLTYTSTDKAGNSSILNRTVQVIDTLAPVITLSGKDTLKLNCNDVYADPGYSVNDNYDTLNASDVTVSGSVNTAVNGTYIITYNAKDKSNNAAATKRRYVVVKGCPNGMDRLINENFIAVFPNPAQSTVYIEPNLPEQITSTMVLYMFDETGKEVYTSKIHQGRNEIDLTNRSSGIYLIRMVAGGESYQVKLIKY